MTLRTKKVKKSKFCKLKKHSRRRLHRRHSSRRYGGSLRKNLHSRRRGGGIIPSGISQIGYSVMGAGQSMADGWNGKSSSFSYVNPSPENQRPVDGGMYQSNHGIL